MTCLCSFILILLLRELFLDFKPTLPSWDKSHLVMVYSPFYMLLDFSLLILCLGLFCICIYGCYIDVWLWGQGDADIRVSSSAHLSGRTSHCWIFWEFFIYFDSNVICKKFLLVWGLLFIPLTNQRFLKVWWNQNFFFYGLFQVFHHGLFDLFYLWIMLLVYI